MSVTAHKVLKGWFVKTSGAKIGRKIKAKRRWLVMDDFMIEYFTDKTLSEKTWKGSILIQDILEVDSKGKEIIVSTKKKKFHLGTDDTKQRQTWVQGIGERMNADGNQMAVIQKAEGVIRKYVTCEIIIKKCCEYIDVLESQNESLRTKNDDLRRKLEELRSNR